MKITIHTVEFTHLDQTYYADCDVELVEAAYHESGTGKNETLYSLENISITDAKGEPIDIIHSELSLAAQVAVAKEEERLNDERKLL